MESKAATLEAEQLKMKSNRLLAITKDMKEQYMEMKKGKL
jgi:hypothetical protein